MARRLWSGTPVGADPFALPRGPLGRAAGRVLALSNRRQNAEVAEELAPRPFHCGLEVGCGPGVLVELLAARPEPVTLVGVDPSAEMVAMAGRRNAAAVRTGRLRLHRGSAAATGEPDAAFDLVVSVNTVGLWPSLDDGLAELHRVLRPGGRAVLSWHLRPTRFALTPVECAQLIAALRWRFGTAQRRDLYCSVLFEAAKEANG
ncbi:class I SAM-dependent methyltransferase [Streptomonospora litoralis]|uniref:Methyltransferase domain-containing protein n=1 Tax=Streptomonospora litoralis TaxID=2498135 RepID=A0A4P6Q4G2_9ACTN|nr:class I SAM-dependent methyltransferase [Streptomonospora litoralis]QBI53714.1 hypothetical protein EKD16_09630 [Streptomonospora litoralis]